VDSDAVLSVWVLVDVTDDFVRLAVIGVPEIDTTISFVELLLGFSKLRQDEYAAEKPSV
jgi:hypothetical protein